MSQSLNPKLTANDPVLEENLTQETLVEKADKQVQTAVEEMQGVVADATNAENQIVIVEKSFSTACCEEKSTKEQLVESLEKIMELPSNGQSKSEIDNIKQAFYKLKRIETEIAEKSFIENGGIKEDFIPEVDPIEETLKEKLQLFREQKALQNAENEKLKEENLQKKKAIIEELKILIESRDDFFKVSNEFRRLQSQWKEIKSVPQASENEIWKAYQHYSEMFYDLLKINNEMRDYDFKKNLDLKIALCDAVDRLGEEKDIISAFYQLQKFHQEWKEIGPVTKELREDLWDRFKKASAIINKKHQSHFEDLRIIEERNLEDKTSICESMESIDYSQLSNFKDWDEKSKMVLELQERWKTIGFAPKKNNIKIFERFRAACDVFFQKKSEYYKGTKDIMDANLEKKKVLCEKVEALKDNQDWRETSDKFIALQKEWKTVGPVSRKMSDVIWKRFIAACDHFFSQKNTHFSSQKTEEIGNLNLKKTIVEKVNAIDITLNSTDTIALVRELMNEFNAIGFVPFKEKDKIYKEYREAVDKHFDRLKIDESERRLQSFKSNLNEIGSGGNDKSKNKLLSEREKLLKTFERLKNDIHTYENNIGFLSVSSKGGGGLVKEMNRKVESLKEELSLIVKKIEVIDENLGFEQ